MPASIGDHASARGLPDFIVIGAQKAGTTSLWTYLRSHPGIYLPEIKELNFFAEEGTWHQGLDWYRSQFAGCAPGQVAGEASPGYTMFPIFAGVAKRMASIVPQAKLVYLVREPLARMVSSWMQSRADGLDLRPLREAFLLDIRYVSLSQYATQLERYLEHFAREQILVLRAEDLTDQPERTVAQVCEFIGVDPAGIRADMQAAHNVSAERMVPRRRTMLAAGALHRARRHDLAYKVVTTQHALTHRWLTPDEIVVDDDLEARMRAYLEPEMVRMRTIVGPEMDLWNYA